MRKQHWLEIQEQLEVEREERLAERYEFEQEKTQKDIDKFFLQSEEHE
jgi:hypothetical protein